MKDYRDALEDWLGLSGRFSDLSCFLSGRAQLPWSS